MHERHKQLTDEERLQIIKQNNKRSSLDKPFKAKKRKLRAILDKQNCESDFILLPKWGK